jgi:uncharacterized protein (TIGR03382 family)
MRKSTLVLAALAAFASAPSHAASKVLSVQEIIQEHDEWCWSATSRAALLHFAVDQQQCAIAEYTRTHSDTPEVNLGTVACCTDWTHGCNNPNYMYDYGGSIEDIVKHFAGLKTGHMGTLAEVTLASTIEAGGLFFIFWKWTADDSGHFLLGHGYDGSSVYYLNPWPGEGKNIADYSWMVGNAEHNWTLTLTALPSSVCQGAPDGTSCDDGDKCTEKDSCTGGLCQGTAKTCSSDTCRGCDPLTGACTGAAMPDGTSCNDGDLCTESDKCVAGQCQGTTKTCSSDVCDAAGTCDPKTGACTSNPLPDGTKCTGGSCKSGSCVLGGSGCSAAGAGPVAGLLGLALTLGLLRRRRPSA